MSGTKRRASCTELFKKFNTIPLASKFLLLLSFVVEKERKNFKQTQDIHNISTRYNLHVPNTFLSKYQKEV
jgi:hypothetical protein